MLRKKMPVFLLAVIFLLTSLTPAFANNASTAIEKIAEVEVILYGTEQRGALLERVDNLEEDINGSSTTDAILTRIDRIYYYVKGSYDSSIPSFITKLNTIEWIFAEKIGSGPAKNRLEEVEKLLLGRADSGCLDDRMDVLLSMAFDSGEIEIQTAIIPRDTLIKISIAQDLNSKNSLQGDEVVFRVEDNIFVGNVLVIPKGALANGYISKVSRARNFGRNAKIEIEYTDIVAIDNTQVAILVGDLAEEATQSLATAAGVSVAGMIILGPVGIVGGAFIKGKEYNIPEGALLYVQVGEDTLVNGVCLSGDYVSSEDSELDEDYYGGL